MTRAFFVGLEIREQMSLSEPGSKEFACDHESDQEKTHEGHHGGKDVPALVFAAFGGIFGKDGNKRDAERRSRDQIVEEIGKGKGGIVGVGHGIGADLVRYHPFAYESQNAAEQNTGHDDGRGGDDAAIYARLAHRIMVEVLRKFA